MKSARATWAVVATVAEQSSVVAAFAAHHAANGAKRVHVYLDRPNPEAEWLLRQVPTCCVTLCDADYWQRVNGGVRPKAVEARQIINAQHAYRTTDATWLAHIDVDEFISPSRPLEEELAQVPEDISVMRLEVRERAFRAGDTDESVLSGLFRSQFPRRNALGVSLFGEGYHYTVRGFTGHVVGKSLVRTGLHHLLMGIHNPRPLRRADGSVDRPRSLECSSSVLLHFEGLTPNHWIEKTLAYSRRLHRQIRDTAFDRIRHRRLRYCERYAENPAALLALHDKIKVLNPEMEQRLRGLGLVQPPAIDPALGLTIFGLEDTVDLSIAGYDMRMREALRLSA